MKERRADRGCCCEWAWWGCLEPLRGTGTSTSTRPSHARACFASTSVCVGARVSSAVIAVHTAYTTHYCTATLHVLKKDFFMKL